MTAETTVRWSFALEMPLAAIAVTIVVANCVAHWCDSGLLGGVCFGMLCIPWVRRKTTGE